MMKLINRSKQSPIGRRACDVALAAHPDLQNRLYCGSEEPDPQSTRECG